MSTAPSRPSACELSVRRSAGPPSRPQPPATPRAGSVRLKSLAPGLALSVAVAVVASRLGGVVPVVGGPVFGIVIGMLIAAVRRPGAGVRPGIAWAGKQGLQIAIVLLGTGLSLGVVLHTGIGSLPVMLGTLSAALLGTHLFGRWLGVRGRLRTLIGVGTGICGASAIAATSGVVGAEDMDVAYAISTIFLFNVTAVLLYPALGHLMGLSQHAFGLWAGTAVNDTSSVVAAGYSFGKAAGDYAVIVKLTRTTMIIPITLGLAVWRILTERRRSGHAAEEPAAPRVHWRRLVPWFVVWFLLASAADTLGLFTPSVQHALARAAIFLIVVALAGIGLSAQFAEMRRTGPRPLLLGALLWATVGVSSLGLQHLTGQW